MLKIFYVSLKISPKKKKKKIVDCCGVSRGANKIRMIPSSLIYATRNCALLNVKNKQTTNLCIRDRCDNVPHRSSDTAHCIDSGGTYIYCQKHKCTKLFQAKKYPDFRWNYILFSDDLKCSKSHPRVRILQPDLSIDVLASRSQPVSLLDPFARWMSISNRVATLCCVQDLAKLMFITCTGGVNWLGLFHGLVLCILVLLAHQLLACLLRSHCLRLFVDKSSNLAAIVYTAGFPQLFLTSQDVSYSVKRRCDSVYAHMECIAMLNVRSFCSTCRQVVRSYNKIFRPLYLFE